MGHNHEMQGFVADYMRQLTDSLRQQERQADVEQLQEIKQQEEEIIRKRQSLTTHRIVLIAAFLVCLFVNKRVRGIYCSQRLNSGSVILYNPPRRVVESLVRSPFSIMSVR